MKKNTAVYTAISVIDSSLSIDVNFLDARVFTTKNLRAHGIDLSKLDKKKKYLCISIETQLEDFESVLDIAAYARPRLLIILGILTFFTQDLFTSFQFHAGLNAVGALVKGQKEKFAFDGVSHLLDFRKVIKFIDLLKEKEKRLLYSLVDRYRKAFFMERESEDNMIYEDETLLSYFHILESLSEIYYTSQKQHASFLINEFVDKIFSEVYLFQKKQIDKEKAGKINFIESAFISHLPVGSKIMYMLQKQGILSRRLSSFIAGIVKDRNAVAHGKQAYQDKVIFPVPPFFPLAKNMDYSMDVLRLLSGRALAIHMGINHLKNEWEQISEDLMPSFEELEDFMNEKLYENASIDDFYSGINNDITPYVVFYHLVNKKLKIKDAIPVVSNLILNYREVEEEISQLAPVALLIVDDATDELKKKCIEVIRLAHDKSWFLHFSMRDFFYHLEYLDHKPKMLREMLLKGEVK
jgi:hypothetical protein